MAETPTKEQGVTLKQMTRKEIEQQIKEIKQERMRRVRQHGAADLVEYLLDVMMEVSGNLGDNDYSKDEAVGDLSVAICRVHELPNRLKSRSQVLQTLKK